MASAIAALEFMGAAAATTKSRTAAPSPLAKGTFQFYPVPSSMSALRDIAAGPDGALWFTGSATDKSASAIGRITSSGSISTYSLPKGSLPSGIVSGPDGALWFGEYGAIGRISTSGQIKQFALSQSRAQVNDLTVGSDGALWFTLNGEATIGRITTSGQVTDYRLPYATANAIVDGPGGDLYFTYSYLQRVGRLTAKGIYSDYHLSAGLRPRDLTSLGGYLWLSAVNQNRTLLNICKFTPATQYYCFWGYSGGLGTVDGHAVTTAFSKVWGDLDTPGWQIFSTDTQQHVTQYNPSNSPGGTPSAIVGGPAHALWFTLPTFSAGYIGELSV